MTIIKIKFLWLLVVVVGLYIHSVVTGEVNQYYHPRNNDELIATQIVFRHGNRTPVDSYPRDPYFDHMPESPGALTDIGIETCIKFGRYLRRRYQSSLGNPISQHEVYMESPRAPRVVDSAHFTLSGLLFPYGNESGEKQTAQVHLTEGGLIDPQVPCPKSDKQVDQFSQSDEVRQLLEKTSGLREYLEKHSGMNVTSPRDLYTIYDALNYERLKGLTLPQWANNVLDTSIDVLKMAYVILLKSYSETNFQRKTRVGFLLRTILNRFKSKANQFSNSKRKMWLYAAHDLNLVLILRSLSVFDNKLPKFSSSILFELRRNRCDYYVQIFYRNSDAEILSPINIPNCGAKCPLDKLYDVLHPVLPSENETFESLCNS